MLDYKMKIDFEKGNGLIPAIIQDIDTRKVLMLGYMNKDAYEQTLQTKKVTFFSRSRNCLWVKGETSGNYLNLKGIKSDCDNDALLVLVKPEGPVCHKGTDTCWGESNKRNSLFFLSELQDFINDRKQKMPEKSYTTTLFKDGINRIAQKVGEEALETVIEAVNGTEDRIVYEGADLLYHLIVLLAEKNLRIETLAQELESRHNPNWRKH